MPWKHLEGWGILSMQGRMGPFSFRIVEGKVVSLDAGVCYAVHRRNHL